MDIDERLILSSVTTLSDDVENTSRPAILGPGTAKTPASGPARPSSPFAIAAFVRPESVMTSPALIVSSQARVIVNVLEPPSTSFVPTTDDVVNDGVATAIAVASMLVEDIPETLVAIVA